LDECSGGDGYYGDVRDYERGHGMITESMLRDIQYALYQGSYVDAISAMYDDLEVSANIRGFYWSNSEGEVVISLGIVNGSYLGNCFGFLFSGSGCGIEERYKVLGQMFLYLFSTKEF
jgi:hypothetical protein